MTPQQQPPHESTMAGIDYRHHTQGKKGEQYCSITTAAAAKCKQHRTLELELPGNRVATAEYQHVSPTKCPRFSLAGRGQRCRGIPFWRPRRRPNPAGRFLETYHPGRRSSSVDANNPDDWHATLSEAEPRVRLDRLQSKQYLDLLGPIGHRTHE